MRSDIIDVFSAFLLLSYGKLMYQSVLLADCPQLIKAESGRLHYGNVDATDFANICRLKRKTSHVSHSCRNCHYFMFMACPTVDSLSG